jgi:hypothetical protein
MTRLISLRPKILILAAAFFVAGGLISLPCIGARIAFAGQPAAVDVAPDAGSAVAVARPTIAVGDAYGLVGMVLGGVALLLAGLSVVLHAVAPRTKNTVDDGLRDDVDKLKGMWSQLLALLGFKDPSPPATLDSIAHPATVTILSQTTATAAGAVSSAEGQKVILDVLRASKDAPAKTPQSGRARLTVMLLLAIFGSIGLGLTAGGCSATTRQDTIKAALLTTDAARDGLRAYEQVHEHAIIQSATSLADGTAKLAAFRTQVDKVVAGLGAAYHALLAASLANDDASLANAQAIATQVIAAVQSLITATGGK